MNKMFRDLKFLYQFEPFELFLTFTKTAEKKAADCSQKRLRKRG